MFLDGHSDKYNLSLGEGLLSLVTGTGIPYSKRHWELSNMTSSKKLVWGHRTIAILEAIPVIGGLVSLIELVTFLAKDRFTNCKSKKDTSKYNAQELDNKKEKKKNIYHFLKKQSIEVANIQAQAFPSRLKDLDEEMQLSGLSHEQVQTLKDNAADFCLITDFFKKTFSLTGAIILGLNHKDIIEGMKKALKCDCYMDAYLRMFNSPNARDDFLEKLTAEGNPIIFLVPRKLYGTKQGVTAGEMTWLFNNPEKMKLVHFVFGAYKVYSKKAVDSEVNSYESKRGDKRAKELQNTFQSYITGEIFKQLRDGQASTETHPSTEAHPTQTQNEEFELRQEKSLTSK